MKPLRTQLEQARKRLGIPWDIIERDYLLSWILAGIGQTASLRDTLVFKGGTALKKCWFGDYRFSEDLHCSGTKEVPSGTAMEDAIRQACQEAVGASFGLRSTPFLHPHDTCELTGFAVRVNRKTTPVHA